MNTIFLSVFIFNNLSLIYKEQELVPLQENNFIVVLQTKAEEFTDKCYSYYHAEFQECQVLWTLWKGEQESKRRTFGRVTKNNIQQTEHLGEQNALGSFTGKAGK